MNDRPGIPHVGTGAGALLAIVLLLLRDNAGLVVAEEVLAFSPVAASFVMGWVNARYGPRKKEIA